MVNTQQKLGIAIAAILIVGWVGYILLHLSRSGAPAGAEVETAPNRKPYYDDDDLETKKLDRSLGIAVVLLAVVALGLPAYWVREAGREKVSIVGFDRRAAARGKNLFQPTDSPKHGAHFGCATCHGIDGGGGQANYNVTDAFGRTRQVKWTAPAINTVAYRYSFELSDDLPKKEVTQLRQVLVYGRPGTPMPAWGIRGGGAMNDQQIDDLVAYLATPKAKGGLMLDAAGVRAQVDLLNKTAAQLRANRENPDEAKPSPALLDGQTLFEAHCARCHTRGQSYGEPGVQGSGGFAPSLGAGVGLRQFPNEADMLKFVSEGVNFGQAYGLNGVMGNESGGMPHFGTLLNANEITAIIEYERSLP